MHEISLVKSVFNTLEAEFSMEDLQRLEAIHLRIGKLSNIEPTLMQNAFDAVSATEEKFQDVALKMEVVDIVVHCDQCNVDSTVHQYKFVCNSCGQPTSNVIAGTELLIHQVQFAD